MPYKLRKAPKKELYWVITIETGKKHSKLPIPLDKAQAQMRVLEATLKGGVRLPRGMHNPSDEGDYDLEDEIERSINPPRELEPRQLRHPLPNDEPDAPPKVVRHPRRDDEPEGPEGPPPAKMSRTSGRAGRGKKGGISYKKFENFLEHLRSIEKHELGNEWYINSDGRLEFYGNFMEPVMALVQAYFSPPEYEKINNSIAKRNIMRLLQTANINEFISLVRELYSGKFEGLIKAFINDVESGKLNIEQQLDKTIELLRLVIIQILREVLEEYAQDPVDLSKYKKEFKPSDKYKKRGGMLRNPLLVLNAEKEAKQIIQMQLTESDGAKGFANGKYSMEEILNRSIQSLIRSDKQEAVAYVQKLIAEYSPSPKYKVQTPEARQELAKAMGFTVGGKKLKGSGHSDELKAAYRAHLSNASPQQRIVLTDIFNTALATIKALPPSRPLLKRITGQPADIPRDERKRLYLRNAIFDMDQVMGLGPNLDDLDDDAEPAVNIPPNPNPAPLDKDFNTECPICNEEVTNNKHRTPCGHVFHQQCFNRTRPIDPVTGLRRCPICRKGSSKKCPKCKKFKV